jgi:arginine N-succinyltransferase
MMLIRPVTGNDVDALHALAVEAGVGMSTLSADRDVLAERVAGTVRALGEAIEGPGDQNYLFVLEDSDTGRIAGCSAIIATVGLTRPFYSYRILQVAHTSQELGRYAPVRVLHLANEYRGATEIATLYLSPAYRRDGNGSFLSRSRFLFMAAFPVRFADSVIAEMRGVQDDRGRSVFWDSLGRHFFDMDFSKADYLSQIGRYQFIADLMPKYPIYICLLPAAAQAVIGVTHDATRPALELLRREGFRFEGCVDVFDAGPTIQCPREDIHTVRASHEVTLGRIVDRLDAPTSMIATERLDRYRCLRGALAIDGSGNAAIDQTTARALGVDTGERLRTAPLRAPAAQAPPTHRESHNHAN